MNNGIFISYSHLDLAEVDHVVKLLKETVNNPVWYDRNLRGGEEFFSTIADQILKNEFFVFMVSDNSVKSPWCIQELEFAMSEGRKVMAVWVKECTPPPRVRLVINNKQRIDAYRFDDNSIKDFFNKAVFNYEQNDAAVASAQENNNVDESKSGIDKYFLTKDELSRIHRVMQWEKNGQYSKCMEPENALYAGLGYDLGIDVETDLIKACMYYKAAAKGDNKDAEFLHLMAEEEIRIKKIDEAAPTDAEEQKKYSPEFIKQMNALADSGSVMAMVYWGEELYNGKRGLAVDKEKAYVWWKIAADQHNHPQALYDIAFGYRAGEILEKDTDLAMMYSLRSAEYGFPRAYRNMAYIYKNEYHDKTKAAYYYQRAIEHGDCLSYVYLADLIEETEPKKALDYYHYAEKLADEGKTNSGIPYYYLAWDYEFGKCGLPKDYEKAVEYFFKAIDRGHNYSKTRIAWCIDKLTDEHEKFQNLLKASELNCDDAEWYIGRIYEKKGDEDSIKTALEWYDKGVEKGSVYCITATLQYYCWLFASKEREKYANRDKSLENFRLLFSIWDKDDDNTKEYYPLHIYNGVYACELAIDENGKKPDQEHALYYFKKAFEFEDHLAYIFPKITTIACAYVAPSYSGGMTFLNPVFAEKLANIAFDHLDAYCSLKDEETEKALGELIGVYKFLFIICKTGLFASKVDKAKRTDYQHKLDTLNVRLEEYRREKANG